MEKVRSINELNIFIKQNTSFTLNQNNLPKIATIFDIIKPANALKDFILWAETICLISKTLTSDEILSIVSDNATIRNMLWPKHDKLNDSFGIELWCQLKVGVLPTWSNITEIINGTDYLTNLCLCLPWRAWKAITSRLKINDLELIFTQTNRLSNPEALLWIWRNRLKISENIIRKLNHVNFFSAISRESDGAIWQAAEKELKKLIQENSDFQDFLLNKDDEENILEFLDRLNSTEAFTTTEKQSLIVKLSRKIPILKKLFESGKAKKITPAKSEENNTRSKDEIFITSIKSFNEKIAELNDIINVQVPENTKAIAVARAHGDLRENAEYAAAKERQKYLNEHRAMLEMRIAITRPTDFSDIIVSDKIIVGSTVHLKHDNNRIEIYHILGSWDSVPEKKYISYETELGKILIGRKVGDTVKLPGGITCIIEKLSPLSDKIRNALI